MTWLDFLSRISVVISTYSVERSKDILHCIDSIRRQTLRPEEIILVLDPDEKLRATYASKLGEDVMIELAERRGLSSARNTGVRKAAGDVVAFIDDDAYADEDWLRNLVRNYVDADVIGVGGVVKPVWENGRPSWFPDELDWVVGCSYKGLPEERGYVRNPIGCNMSFRKEAFEKAGYFDENLGRVANKLTASEETELAIRLLREFPGSPKIVHEPHAIVYHKVTRRKSSLKYFMKRSFGEGVSKRLLERLRPDVPGSLSFEHRYLKYLLNVSIPLRLRRLRVSKSDLQLFSLFLSIALVLTGYLVTYLIVGVLDRPDR